MSDHRVKFIKLLKYCGIEFELDDNDILIDPFYTDGMSACWIMFNDDGEFEDFYYYPLTK